MGSKHPQYNCILFSFFSQYLPYQCLPIFTNVYQCLPMFTNVYHCLPMFTNFYQCLPMFSNVYQCLLMFTKVYQCLPMFTNVFQCLPIFSDDYQSFSYGFFLPTFVFTFQKTICELYDGKDNLNNLVFIFLHSFILLNMYFFCVLEINFIP